MTLGNREMLRRWITRAALSACVLPAAAAFTDRGAAAQTGGFVKIVVPYTAGGGGSVLARVFADQIERQQRVKAVVENRPGAATVVGTEAVARSAPDGETLLITNLSLLVNPHLRKQNYDPVTSFEAVCDIASVPIFIAVNSASPYHSLTDLLNAAREKPGDVTIATFVATAGYIGLERLKRMANVNITLVPFPGSAPAVTALLGGHVTGIVDNYATVAEHVHAGKLRVLATAWPTRLEALPDIPTIAEAGVKGYGLENWWGVFVPAKTPKDKVAQLAGWFSDAAHAPEVTAKLAPLGFYPTSICGTEFAAMIRQQYDDLGTTIREANIHGD